VEGLRVPPTSVVGGHKYFRRGKPPSGPGRERGWESVLRSQSKPKWRRFSACTHNRRAGWLSPPCFRMASAAFCGDSGSGLSTWN